ncbi:MAG: hypothetical protein JXM72_02215 [Deltaproteobacteria bacterium]|nr:hypothetical protein [Deltaproteobacteria bacterium]
MIKTYDPASCIIRFLGAALFGVFVDIVIAFLYGLIVMMGYVPSLSGLLYILLAVPLVWGVLGIFFFTEMLDLTKDILKRFFRL